MELQPQFLSSVSFGVSEGAFAYNLLPQWLSLGFDPCSTTSMIVFSFTHNYPRSQRVDLASTIRKVETKQFLISSGMFCLRVIDPTNPLPCFGLALKFSFGAP